MSLSSKQIEVAKRIGDMVREAFPVDAEKTLELRYQVLIWLGYWRDKILPEAVAHLQDILDAQRQCTECDGKGWYATGETDKPKQEQCEFCYGTGRIGAK